MSKDEIENLKNSLSFEIEFEKAIDNYINAKSDKMLSPGEIEKLKKGGVQPHDLKENARQDLFKDKKGNISVKRKGGKGPGEPTGLNINDF